MAGNKLTYFTSNGCSSGLSMGCSVYTGPSQQYAVDDAWYYDGGGYSFRTSAGVVVEVNTDPCAPAPTVPTPTAFDYYTYDACTGPKQYLGILLFYIGIPSGTTAPSSINISGRSECFSVYSSGITAGAAEASGYTSSNCYCN